MDKRALSSVDCEEIGNWQTVSAVDGIGPGGACHAYEIEIEGRSGVDRIQFQKGPRNEPGSTPGITEGALLAIVADRLRHFQEGNFACRENNIALAHVEEAIAWLARRAKTRRARGVLGTNKA